jgi:hypothetical protein
MEVTVVVRPMAATAALALTLGATLQTPAVALRQLVPVEMAATQLALAMVAAAAMESTLMEIQT